MEVSRRVRLALPEHIFARLDAAAARAKLSLPRLIAAELIRGANAVEAIVESEANVVAEVAKAREDAVREHRVSVETHQISVEILLLLRHLAGEEHVKNLHQSMMDADFTPYGVSGHGR